MKIYTNKMHLYVSMVLFLNLLVNNTCFFVKHIEAVLERKQNNTTEPQTESSPFELHRLIKKYMPNNVDTLKQITPQDEENNTATQQVNTNDITQVHKNDRINVPNIHMPAGATASTKKRQPTKVVEPMAPPTATLPMKTSIDGPRIIEQPPILHGNITNEHEYNGSPSSKVTPHVDSGMLFRSFYVVLGLTALAVVCFLFKAYRSGRPPSNVVNKYGVRTYRNDVEMTPLPTGDDDDDEDTLFETTTATLKSENNGLHYYDYTTIPSYEIK